MMRSWPVVGRDNTDRFRASTYQHAPQFLLFQEGAPWLHMPLLDIGAAMARRMPADCRRGWHLIHRGLLTADNEPEAARAADWIELHGRGYGFRTPTVAERTRGSGLGAYIDTLGLGYRAAYDAQGNAFHPAALALRTATAIRQWLAGQPPPRVAVSEPAALLRQYAALRAD
eukprot:15483986-Alexandrium_andersonii.AAC.1